MPLSPAAGTARVPQPLSGHPNPFHGHPRAFQAQLVPWACLGTPIPVLCPPQEQAFESSQKYKEGKFIIEMSHMVKENGWD